MLFLYIFTCLSSKRRWFDAQRYLNVTSQRQDFLLLTIGRSCGRGEGTGWEWREEALAQANVEAHHHYEADDAAPGRQFAVTAAQKKQTVRSLNQNFCAAASLYGNQTSQNKFEIISHDQNIHDTGLKWIFL